MTQHTIIAFIGLGNMGSGMAKNLVVNGFVVKAFDLSQDALNKAADNGCQPCSSVAEAVAGASTVISMLPAGKHVQSVYSEQIFAHAAPDTLLIDCSTIDVATAQHVAKAASERGFAMLDAPVSGGTKAADAGTLTFMVGGEQAAFELGQAALNAMGGKVVHAGKAGTGQAAKICNNMLLGASMVATCEALQLAGKLGLDQQVFFDIAANASGQNWSLTSYCPVKGVGPQSPADNDFAGGFAAALMLKDLNLAKAAAEQVQAAVPMGDKAAALYQALCEQGHQGKDFSVIIQHLQELSAY